MSIHRQESGIWLLYYCAHVHLCVEKGNICDQNDPTLHYFAQMPPMHPTPKVPKGHLPTPLTLATAM